MNNRIHKLENTVTQLVSYIKNNINNSENKIPIGIDNTNNNLSNYSNRYETNTIKKEDFDSFGGNNNVNLDLNFENSKSIADFKNNGYSANRKKSGNVWSEILQELKVSIKN
jgi:hypothetical protein